MCFGWGYCFPLFGHTRETNTTWLTQQQIVLFLSTKLGFSILPEIKTEIDMQQKQRKIIPVAIWESGGLRKAGAK